MRGDGRCGQSSVRADGHGESGRRRPKGEETQGEGVERKLQSQFAERWGDRPQPAELLPGLRPAGSYYSTWLEGGRRGASVYTLVSRTTASTWEGQDD